MHPYNRVSLAVVLAAASAAVTAHPGHDTHGLAAGLAHPLGADHLLAMLAVGLWSARAPGLAARLAAPLAFMLALLTGALAAQAGLMLALTEPAIALSVALMGALLAAPQLLSRPAALAAIAVAGLLHGLAHGAEAPLAGGLAPYAAGFLATTAALHAAGLAIGIPMARLQAWVWRAAGAAFGLAGLALLAGA